MGYLNIVDNAINELIDDFKTRKDYFFNEHDIHHVFFCKLSELGNLVHPEYPTLKRFTRIRGKKTDETYKNGIHCFKPGVKKGVRGHYDFVVLNNRFTMNTRIISIKYPIKQLILILTLITFTSMLQLNSNT